jgi:hypothetical protein
MTGRGTLTAVPDEVQERLLALYEHASTCLGPVRMEWVADAGRVWVVQLHRGATKSSGSTIYPGIVPEIRSRTRARRAPQASLGARGRRRGHHIGRRGGDHQPLRRRVATRTDTLQDRISGERVRHRTDDARGLDEINPLELSGSTRVNPADICSHASSWGRDVRWP